MKKKHLRNGGRMKEEEVRISRLRWEGRGDSWGGAFVSQGGRRDLEKLSFTFT